MNISALGLSIIQPVVDFISTLGRGIGLDNLFLVSLLLLIIIFATNFAIMMFSYETRLSRSVNKILSYLYQKPKVTNENIVEFNRLMKRVPAKFRYQWQRYMLNRDKKPSNFVNVENCVEKPLKVSSFGMLTFYLKIAVGVLCVLSFVLGLGAATISSTKIQLPYFYLNICLIPVLLIILAAIYITFMNLKIKGSVNDLYYKFEVLEKALDDAVVNMPAFVDYEILFTKKEIASGIPALQEYLEQRANYEEELLRKAKESEVEHEDYDFSTLGVDGSMVMEKTIRESEYYLGNRKRLQEEIDNVQVEIDKLEKNYEDETKLSQRKLRDIKDELERLREKLATTNNKIIANDIRKQQADESKKQQIIEAEIEEATKKYNEELDKLNAEVQNRKDEIAKAKAYMQNVLLNEFTTFNTKSYDAIEKKLNEDYTIKKENLDKQTNDAMETADKKTQLANEFEALYNEKLQVINQYQQALENIDKEVQNKDQEIAELNEFKAENEAQLTQLIGELESAKKTILKFNKKKRSGYSTSDDEVEEMQETMRQQEEKISQYEETLTNISNVMNEKDEEIEKLKKGILLDGEVNTVEDIQDNLLAERDAQISNYQNEIQEMNENNANKDAKIEEQQAEIERLNAIVENSEKEVNNEEVNKLLEEKDNEIQEKNEEIEKLKETISNSETTGTDNVEIQKIVEEKDNQIQEQSAEIERLQTLIEEKNEQLENAPTGEVVEKFRFFDLESNKEFFFDEHKKAYCFDDNGEKVYLDEFKKTKKTTTRKRTTKKKAEDEVVEDNKNEEE